MEVRYDRAALQAYMDDIGNVSGSLRSSRDQSMNSYHSCKQQYTRLHTEIEQASRRAYNMLESAESMRRAAAGEYEAAMRKADNAQDDSARDSALAEAQQARRRLAEAETEVENASLAYAKAQEKMATLTSVWEKYQPSAESASRRMDDNFIAYMTLTGNSSRELGEYIGVMEKARNALYDGVSDTSPARNGVAMTIAGENYVFPATKSGMARAYRTAVQKGDTEMAAKTSQIFKNQQYVKDTQSALKQGLPETFDKEMVMAGAQGRKLNKPDVLASDSSTKGVWKDNVYFLADDYVPEKCNDSGLTIAEIKQQLQEKYNIKVEGIPYVNGVADFSGISVANIPTSDIAMKSQGLSQAEYERLSQRERTQLFQDVFSDVGDGKSKRNRNFHLADQIASERQIPIPGLQAGYTATQLAEWRKDNKFSWDEQVHGGYNLVPTVIHGNVSHTGLVSTSRNAHGFLGKYESELKEHPEKYSWDEAVAPISISELEES